VERDLELAGLSIERPSLEDIYLQLTDDDAPSRKPERSMR
jgi:hypothetical protein